MTIKNLREAFRESGSNADLLSQFEEYWYDENIETLGDFSLVADGDNWSLAWFANDADVADRFTVFAITRNCGLFALWHYDENDVANPPVVFLASECVGSKVISHSIPEFLSLLALGSDKYASEFRFVEDREWRGLRELTEAQVAVRDWLEESLGICKAENPRQTILQGMARHPDLMEWIENWQEATLDN